VPLAPSAQPAPGACCPGRVFVGGSYLRGQRPIDSKTVNLVAFSATGTGTPLRFSPQVGEVNVLAVWRRTLLVGAKDVVALPVGGDGQRELWRRRTNDIVFAFATRPSTLYAGGRFILGQGQPRRNLAAFALDRRGTLLLFAPRMPIQVMALVPLGADIVFGGFDVNGSSRQVLGAAAKDGTLNPWRRDMPALTTRPPRRGHQSWTPELIAERCVVGASSR
jgi:hypothetical protein